MSIAAVTMARANAMQYYSAFNAFNTMDAKRSLANDVHFGSASVGTNYRDLANKDKAYDLSLQKDSLNYQAGNLMYKQAKALQNEWANSFNVFA